MCYVNEAAFDDDDDDDDVDCCREELCTGPLCSPDLIAGARMAAQQASVSCEDGNYHFTSALSASRPSTELHYNELGRETGVCYCWKLSKFHCDFNLSACLTVPPLTSMHTLHSVIVCDCPASNSNISYKIQHVAEISCIYHLVSKYS